MQINDRDVNRINNYANIINDVKLEEVNELASSLLEPENLFFVEVGKTLKVNNYYSHISSAIDLTAST